MKCSRFAPVLLVGKESVFAHLQLCWEYIMLCIFGISQQAILSDLHWQLEVPEY